MYEQSTRSELEAFYRKGLDPADHAEDLESQRLAADALERDD